VHHTGTGPARPTIQDTTAYQIGPSAQVAFPGFAYTGFVEADGSIRVAWDVETVTYSQGDGSATVIDGVGSNNYHGIAFCFSGENPTDPQVAALHRIHVALTAILGRPIAVRGHREVSGRSDTDCPGDQMIQRLGEV